MQGKTNTFKAAGRVECLLEKIFRNKLHYELVKDGSVTKPGDQMPNPSFFTRVYRGVGGDRLYIKFVYDLRESADDPEVAEFVLSENEPDE